MVEYADVKGHIYSPLESGFPFISVVLFPGKDPVVSMHNSLEEATAKNSEQIMLLRRMITTDKKI